MTAPYKYCLKCNHQGQTKAFYHGHILVESLAWVLVFVYSASISNFFPLIIPFLYSLYRQYSKKYICEACGSSEFLVEPDSQAALERKSSQ